MKHMLWFFIQLMATANGKLSSMSATQLGDVLAKHNELRRNMGASDMMMMVWNDTVASHAQAWADKCPGSAHSNSSDRLSTYDGENMAQAAGSHFVLTDNTDLTGSVEDWYNEIWNAGDYKNGGTFTGFGVCNGTCGHFTQVVWASANALGCGVAACQLNGLDGYVLVCQYHATVSGTYGGNMGTKTLFTKGTACSDCPSDYQTCTDSLCSAGTSDSTGDGTSESTSEGISDSTSTSATASDATSDGVSDSSTTSSTTSTTTSTTSSDIASASTSEQGRRRKRRRSGSSSTPSTADWDEFTTDLHSVSKRGISVIKPHGFLAGKK